MRNFVVKRELNLHPARIISNWPVLLGTFLAISACDFYEDEINEDWSLCAVDDPNDMTLCRNLDDGNYHGVLDPVMVAWGYNGRYIALRRCSEGEEDFYSVDANDPPLYEDPAHVGPLDRTTFLAESEAEPDRWPPLSHEDRWLAKKHCPVSD